MRLTPPMNTPLPVTPLKMPVVVQMHPLKSIMLTNLALWMFHEGLRKVLIRVHKDMETFHLGERTRH